MLEQAGMTFADVVKVTQYLTHAEDVSAYAKVRSRFLGDARPASMLLVVPNSYGRKSVLKLRSWPPEKLDGDRVRMLPPTGNAGGKMPI